MYPYPPSGQYQPISVPQPTMPSHLSQQGQPGQQVYPYYPQEPQHHPGLQFPQLKRETLRAVDPFVQYGLKEAQHTSYPHAFREVAAISYLLGKGYDPRTAHRIVESWEVNEHF